MAEPILILLELSILISRIAMNRITPLLSIALINVFCVLSGSAQETLDAATLRAQALEYSDKLAVNAILSNREVDRIGALAKYRYWRTKIPLADNQIAVITKLDMIVREARSISYKVDSKYLKANPDSFPGYLQRNEARRAEMIRSAQKMVEIGLLTRSQRQRLLQQMFSRQNLSSLLEQRIQVLLGLTDEQRFSLAEVPKQMARNTNELNLHQLPPEQEQTELRELKRAAYAEAKNILTPKQLQLWSLGAGQLTLPREPPTLVSPSSTGEAKREMLADSPVLRFVLDDDSALDLNPAQTRLIEDFGDVTVVGLAWIDSREASSNETDSTRTDFLTQAELLVVNGILTEQEARKVEQRLR